MSQKLSERLLRLATEVEELESEIESIREAARQLSQASRGGSPSPAPKRERKRAKRPYVRTKPLPPPTEQQWAVLRAIRNLCALKAKPHGRRGFSQTQISKASGVPTGTL